MADPTLDPITRGDYQEIPFAMTEPDPANPGQRRPRDISADSLRFSAKRKITDDAALIAKTSAPGGGILKTNPASGEGVVVILGDDTRPLKLSPTRPLTLVCDIEGTAPGNPPRPYTTRFNLPVEPDVST